MIRGAAGEGETAEGRRGEEGGAYWGFGGLNGSWRCRPDRPEDSWEARNLPAVITNHIFYSFPFISFFLFFERYENLIENINDLIVSLLLQLYVGAETRIISFLHFIFVPFLG